MSGNVHWILEVGINDGELDNFKQLMNEMVEATQANEPGALNYEWFISEDGKTCHINEWFRDTAAHAAHGQGFAKFADRFLACVDIVRMTVYGDPEPKAREALAGLNPTYLAGIGGFRR